MKHELARLEGSGGNKPAATGSIGQGLDSVGLLRNVKYQEVIFELLAKQYEIAKIDEAKDSAVVQVMDRALAPERKSKPFRTLIVLVTAIVALFAGAIAAFACEAFARVESDPGQAARLRELKRYLGWRNR